MNSPTLHSDHQVPKSSYERQSPQLTTQQQITAQMGGRSYGRERSIAIFRLITIIFSPIGCAMYGGAGAIQERYISTDMSIGIFDFLTIGPLAFSFLFSVFFVGIPYLRNLQVRYAKHRNCNTVLKPFEPPHPAVSVSLDLLAWMYLAAMFLIMCIFETLTYSYNYCRYNVDESTCQKAGQGARALEIIAFICVIISMISHFALFVYACRDTQRLNKAKKEKRKKASSGGEDIEL